MNVKNLRLAFFQDSLTFLKRQHRDWKVTVVRTSLERFAYRMALPYISIYIIALGATATQLGIVNSIGMAVAGIIAPLTGWLMDKNGPKFIYLVGISLLAVFYFLFGIANFWQITIAGMVAYWVGFSVSIQSCATICGTCLSNRDRATGMMICETVAAGVLGMAGPMLSAWIVVKFGGTNIEGIRPVFFACAFITIISFVYILLQLSNQRIRLTQRGIPSENKGEKSHASRDILRVLKGDHRKRWLVIAAIGQVPLSMVFPFAQLYAYQVKSATPFVLGAMVTGAAATSIVFAIPLGRWADRIGRKTILYIVAPLFWVSCVMLVWAPHPAFLILAGIMQGFYYIAAPIAAAMERELVPPDQMGTWVGVARAFRMMLNAGLTLACGIIWDRVGPQYVFLIFVAIDVIIRMPLLINMPETLGIKFSKQTA